MSDTTASENFDKFQDIEIIYVEEQAPEPWDERKPYYDKDLPIPLEDGSLSVRQISSSRVPSPLMRLKSPLSDHSQNKYFEDNRASPVPSFDRSLKTEKREVESVSTVKEISVTDGTMHNVPIESDTEESKKYSSDQSVKFENISHSGSSKVKESEIIDVSLPIGKNTEIKGNSHGLNENIIPENDYDTNQSEGAILKYAYNGSSVDQSAKMMISEHAANGLYSLPSMQGENNIQASNAAKNEENLDMAVDKSSSSLNEIVGIHDDNMSLGNILNHMNGPEQFESGNENMFNHIMEHETNRADEESVKINRNSDNEYFGNIRSLDLKDKTEDLKDDSDRKGQFNTNENHKDDANGEIIGVSDSNSVFQGYVKTEDDNLDESYFASLIPLPESHDSLASENEVLIVGNVDNLFRDEIEPVFEHPPIEGEIEFGPISEIDNDHFWEESNSILVAENHSPGFFYPQDFNEKDIESTIKGNDNAQKGHLSDENNLNDTYLISVSSSQDKLKAGPIRDDGKACEKSETENLTDSFGQNVEVKERSTATTERINEKNEKSENIAESENEFNHEYVENDTLASNKNQELIDVDDDDDGDDDDYSDCVELNVSNNLEENVSCDHDSENFQGVLHNTGATMIAGAGVGALVNSAAYSENMPAVSISKNVSSSISSSYVNTSSPEDAVVKNIAQSQIVHNPEEMNRLLFLFDSVLASEEGELDEHLKSNDIVPDLYVSNWLQTLFSCENFSAEVSEMAQSENDTRGPEALVELAIDLMKLNKDDLLNLNTKKELLEKLNSDMDVEGLEAKRNFILGPELLDSLNKNWEMLAEREKGKVLANRLALLEARNRNADDLLRQLAEIIQEMNDDIVELVNENNEHRLKIKSLQDALLQKLEK